MSRRALVAAAVLLVASAGCTEERRSVDPDVITSEPSGPTGPTGPTTTVVVPSGAPPYVDVTDSAGLRLAGNTVDESAARCGGGKRLERTFPDLIRDGGESLDVDLCQNERMGAGVAVGDVNGDGLPDIYVTRMDEAGRLFVAESPLMYRDATESSGVGGLDEPSMGAAFADVDNDDDLDLVVSTTSSRAFSLFVNDGSGRFVDEGRERGVALDNGSPHMGMSIAVGDIDRDGFVDLLTTEWRSPFVAPDSSYNARLLRNEGASNPGHFEDRTEAAGVELERPANPAWSMGAQFADLDGDGWQDLAVTSDYGTSRLFWNDGDGTFTDGTEAAGVGTDENGMGSAIADVDGDGRPDWFVTGIYSDRDFCSNAGCGFGRSGNRLFHNEGNRRFTDVTNAAGVRDAGWAWGAAFLDIGNRGHLDLITAAGYEFSIFEEFGAFAQQPMRTWANDGTGHFGLVEDRRGLTTRDGKAVLVFDADLDGRLDVLITTPGTSPELFHNETAAAGHHLRVRVRGTRSNHDGLGAVVTIRPVADGPVITREVTSTTGYLAWSETVVHVGLGDRIAPVAEVEVLFPASGRRVVRQDVPVDQTLEIVEPDS